MTHEAKYTVAELEEYSGNPLIEALPPIPDESEILKLNRYPPYNSNERKLRPVVRLHCLDRLFDVVQSQPEYRDVIETISRLIRAGYKSRNPLIFLKEANLVATSLATAKNISDVESSSAYAQCRSAAYLTGLSGMGKTTIIERVLNCYPQVIKHTSYHGTPFTQTQVVWLKLDCPRDHSVKTLCLSFFNALDNALKVTNYATGTRGRNASNDDLILRMGRLIQTYHIGILILDELNLLTKAPRKGEQNLLETFLQLINVLGIPLYLAGTFESASLFDKTLRNSRRVSFSEPTIMDRYKADDPGWLFFLQTLWRYQWTAERVALTNDMSLAMYDASQGITDIAVKIYSALQRQAIRNKQETFTEKDVREVIPLRFPLLHSAIGALQRGSITDYEQFRELCPPKELWLRQEPPASDAERMNQRYLALAAYREGSVGSGETIQTEPEGSTIANARREKRSNKGKKLVQQSLESLDADVIPSTARPG